MKNTAPNPEEPSLTNGGEWSQWVTVAEAEVVAVINSLPPDVRDRLAELPITFEAKPNAAMTAGGIHPDYTVGLFTGVPYPCAIAVSQHLPPQIILFLDNLRACVRHDPAEFRAQVRRTLLHEIGHFLGLDETGVGRRGL